MSELASAHILEEDDPEDALRVQQELYARRVQQRLQEEREVSGVIIDQYRTAWGDFYAQEAVQSAQLLRSLEVASPHSPPALDDLFDSTGPDEMDLDPDMPGDTILLELSDILQLAASSEASILALPEVSSYAYPKYEACTPSTESIRYRGDARILPFVQYADEPTFQVEQYVSKHVQLGWQTEWFDVDVKLVAADALLRLEEHDINHEKIDRFKPPYLPSPTGAFMSFLRKRDLPDWGSQRLPQHRASSMSVATSLSAAVSGLVSHFCGSVNCNRAKCFTHDVRTPPVTVDAPTISNEELHNKGKVKCGDDCFLQFGYAPLLTEPSLDQDICDLLKQFPDHRPCRLATLARTTCYNVFHHRCYTYPDGQPLATNTEGHFDLDSESLTFCVHPGPCTKHNNCPCVKNRTICQRRCRCATYCPLRQRGCKCGGDKPGDCTCLDTLTKIWPLGITDECENNPANAVVTECNPELCKNLKRRRKGKKAPIQKHQCSNMDSQLNRLPHVSVKIGSWGLGTFAEHTISKGAFIGEYISEIIFNPEDEDGGEGLDRAQGMVNTQRRLNYLFNVPGNLYNLDAATVGNPTRYFNDPRDDKKANVISQNQCVDGEVKVVFISTKAIQPGQELMLWYGENYWEDNKHVTQ